MLDAMTDERNGDSSLGRRKLWGAIWLLIAVGLYQSVWQAGRAQAAERETWPHVTAEVIASEVTYDNSGEVYQLTARLAATVDGQILHDDFPKRIGKKADLERDLEAELAVGAKVECLLDPAHPGALVVPPAHDQAPLLMGLIPAIVFALIGLRMLLTGAPAGEATTGRP